MKNGCKLRQSNSIIQKLIYKCKHMYLHFVDASLNPIPILRDFLFMPVQNPTFLSLEASSDRTFVVSPFKIP